MNNTEPIRSCQGYIIKESEVICDIEIVLAKKETAPQPFVTWRRSILNDIDAGQENFYWGHYAKSESVAKNDFKQRVTEEWDYYLDKNPSIKFQLQVHKQSEKGTKSNDIKSNELMR